MKNATKPDLVLGAFVHYGWEALRPYVISLLRTGYRGDIVLLCDHADELTLRKLSEHKVQCYKMGYPRSKDLWNSWGRFWIWAKPIITRVPLPSVRFWLQAQLTGLVWFRYYAAWRFLAKRAHLYRRIVWSDVRDVIFQTNPSDGEELNCLHAAKENPDLKFSLCPHTGPWIKTVLGCDKAKEFDDLTPSCCGAVFGDSDSTMAYFQRYVELSLEVRAVSHGGDTAIHNQIVYHPGRERSVLHEYGEGPLLHLCTNDIRRDNSGVLVNQCGDPFTLIHFFDRFPNCFKRHPVLNDIVTQFVIDRDRRMLNPVMKSG